MSRREQTIGPIESVFGDPGKSFSSSRDLSALVAGNKDACGFSPYIPVVAIAPAAFQRDVGVDTLLQLNELLLV